MRKTVKIIFSLMFVLPQLQAQIKEVKFNLKSSPARIYTTSQADKQKNKLTNGQPFIYKPQPLETEISIFVDPTHQFEEFIGFGGAITDASAEVYAKLPKDKQKEVIKAYYDSKDGLGYRVVRTNMNSCDFSSKSYTYIKDNDVDLKTFDISVDKQYKIPMIKEAQKAIGRDFTFYFSPWSPPAWMKTTNSMLAGGELKKEYYPVWAKYYTKFIDAYEKEGIPVWGLTIQNEPMAATPWEATIYTAEKERDFLKYHLGPELWNAGKKDKKIIIWDHNRDLAYQYISTIMNDSEAAKYVWGAGFHWYETWTKSLPLFDNQRLVKQAFPSLNLLFTEGCQEKFDMSRIEDISIGELYGHHILNDLNSGFVAWTDWNVLLDEKGGPNHLNNFCFAPIHADTKTGKIYYTYPYWYIGHFSKYINKGARRVIASSNRSQLETTSFLNPDGKLVVVVLNRTDSDYDYYLWIAGKASPAKSQAHSISTWVL